MKNAIPSRKVLVVDDEPVVRHTLDLVLRHQYDVVTAGSGEEALRLSQEEAFPVVILDLCMDGLSGIETLKRLRRQNQEQYVIILTAYQSMDTAIAALNLGAFNYLTKPIDRDHLLEVITQGFERYESVRRRTEDMKKRLMGIHDAFFSILCHEFNTPLNAIIGFSEMMKAVPGDSEVQSWAQHICDAGNRLHEVLMEIVDYIAAAHLADPAADQHFLLGKRLSPVLQSAHERGIELRLLTDKAAAEPLKGHADAIELIIKKLVQLASRKSRKIRIEASILDHDGQHLAIALKGTGLYADNFEAAEIELLFEPYGLTYTDEGQLRPLGLELAICRKVAEYAHATITGSFNANNELEFAIEIPVTRVGASEPVA